MLVELHIVQNFSPSCLNRDDLNAPKECEFGGVRRARISSQSLKRATRWHADFAAHLANRVGTRTRVLKEHLTGYLVSKGRKEEEARLAVMPLEKLIAKPDQKDPAKCSVALYLAQEELDRLATLAEKQFDALLALASAEASDNSDGAAKGSAGKKPKKDAGGDAIKDIKAEVAKILDGAKAADIALFGRMIAEATNFNVDAAAQVAHAISTHAVPSEFDFFTAVDDLQAKGDPGAGMMGTQQFNSATFYRYANVHMNQLGANLGDDAALARSAALAFVHAFIMAIPAARQNSHAAQNPPDLVFAVIRSKGQPLSLANAFVKHIGKTTKLGLVGESAHALARYWARTAAAYGTEGIVASPFYSVSEECDGVPFDNASRVAGLSALLATIESALAKWTPEARK